ncbi:hypothetical protein BTJ39_04930 [Izhakiella australiensis]|uniref:Amino acid permease/ SLC12A domain-containing protein n=1 Tax=Izhakiella australiensis TaxID=1926881 RepID=A0A1S8YQF9_9GAMM|nr:hypothetical protein BTJ39_04930 [Izhakiella australiensis]
MSSGEPSSPTGLRHVLKRCHMFIIAIGGSVGTGLFIASGAIISPYAMKTKIHTIAWILSVFASFIRCSDTS